MSNKHLERTIIQEHLSSAQSTHGTSPQASAARLIRLLRETYPLVSTQDLMSESAAVAMKPISEKDAQIALMSYLTSLINGEIKEEAKEPEDEAYQSSDFDTALSHPSTVFTIHLISTIKKRHEMDLINADDFKILCQQMKLLAGTCPGINWNDNHKHWSTNTIYNALSKQEEQVLASPAETLNLLARALLDKSRHKEQNESFRIASFCECVLALGRSARPICSAGKQHELLFLLNQSYLDKPLASDGAPIRMYESTSGFIASAFSNYLEHELNKASPLDRVTLILNDLKEEELAETPLIHYLRSHALNGNWKASSRAVLENACQNFGLNPLASDIKTKIDAFLTEENLAYVTLPMGTLPIVPALQVIFETPIPTPRLMAAAAAAHEHPLDVLWQKAAALKATITPQFCLDNPQRIRILASLMESMTWLQYDTQFPFLLQTEDEQFMQARERLYQQVALLLEDDSYPETFYQAKSHYEKSKLDYKNSEHISFIENFFALTRAASPEEQASFIQRMKEIQQKIILKDAQLIAWYHEKTAMNENDGMVLELSPYEINRILMHAMIEPSTQWSEHFHQTLQLVTEYLSALPAATDSIQLATLKKSYLHYFTSNLLLLSLIMQSQAISMEVKETYQSWLSVRFFKQELMLESILAAHLPTEQKIQIWRVISDKLRPMQTLGVIWRLFSLSEDQLTEAQRTQILTVVSDKLGIMIQTGSQLHKLFSLSKEKLTQAQRDIVLTAVSDKLSTMFRNGRELYKLFSLPKDQLTEAQRTQILTEVGDKLGPIIQDGTQLYNLFLLPKDQLTEAQRTQILTGVGDKLGPIIQDGTQLYNLFLLPKDQLTEAQRTQILTGVGDKLGPIIQDRTQLYNLFLLSKDQLTEAQRTQILTEVGDKLGTIIQDGNQLYDLFLLSEDQLTEAQRTQILTAVSDQLSTMIENGNKLLYLFSLYKDQLTEVQRTQILTAVGDKLGTIIQDLTQLYDLFYLSKDRLTEAQRTQILIEVSGQLGTIIQNWYDLYKLFCLDKDQLTEAQRTHILTAVGDKLSTIIQDLTQLYDLFYLPKDLLTEAQRTQILTAISDKLGTMIQDGTQLYNLFALSKDQLTEAQRTQIWMAVSDKLGTTMIKNGYDLYRLFSLPKDQLTEAQGTQLLTAIGDILGAMIQDVDLLFLLFCLPKNNLTETQRTQILTAVSDNLGTMMEGGYLQALFSLPIDQLTEAQRTQILTAVSDKLGTMIQNEYELYDLFALSKDQLKEAQRTQIWMAVSDKLGTMIKNGTHLCNLFALSKDQLTVEQRTQILIAVSDKLSTMIEDGYELRNLFALPSDQLTDTHRQMILKAKNRDGGVARVGLFSPSATPSTNYLSTAASKLDLNPKSSN